jgi:protein-S-isoprenylcysteine O-methyltransferase Ste14
VTHPTLPRAIAAFVALPGVVAFAVPIAVGLSSASTVRNAPAAVIVLVSGILLLLWCVREFYVAGRGTLAPWAPPEQLVTSGPYRFCRNPMYVAVLVILLAWWLLWGETALLVYAVLVLCAFHLRVILAEEPWAARHFGAQWGQYRARVPRWLIRGLG